MFQIFRFPFHHSFVILLAKTPPVKNWQPLSTHLRWTFLNSTRWDADLEAEVFLALIPGVRAMKSALAVLIGFLCWPGISVAQENRSRWDCFCEGRPCACSALPQSNPQLCDIQCPRNSKFVPDCSCEPLRNGEESEEERRQKRLEREKIETQQFK